MPEKTAAEWQKEAEAAQRENEALRSAKADPTKHYAIDVGSVIRNHGKFAQEQMGKDDKWLDKVAGDFVKEMADLNVPKSVAQGLFDREMERQAKSWGARTEERAKQFKAQAEALGLDADKLKALREAASEDFDDDDKGILKMLAGTENPDEAPPALLAIMSRLNGDEGDDDTTVETNPGDALSKSAPKGNSQFKQAKPKDPKKVVFIDDPKLKGVYFDPKDPDGAAELYWQLTDVRNDKGEATSPDYSIPAVEAAWSQCVKATTQA